MAARAAAPGLSSVRATMTGADPRVWPQVMMLARDQDAAVRTAILSGTAGIAGLQSERAHFVARLADDPDPVARRRVAVMARRHWGRPVRLDAYRDGSRR